MNGRRKSFSALVRLASAPRVSRHLKGQEARRLKLGGSSISKRSSTPAKRPLDDFELATVAEGLERLTGELSEALDRAKAKVLADALRIYYAAEELARDPANAHLIPQVEAMRRAYEHDYGVPRVGFPG